MPLLPREPFLYPDNLLAMDPSGELPPREWWVLHTRPRAEKTLARKCVDNRLPFFLPLYIRKWRNEGRLFRSHLPLFPGYLFLHGDIDARAKALSTNLVAQALAVPDQQQLAADLARVHRLMVSNMPLTPEKRVELGMRVEVVGGPFAGMEGRVVGAAKQLKFIIDVEFLNQGVSVEMGEEMIQPLRNPDGAALAGGLARR